MTAEHELMLCRDLVASPGEQLELAHKIKWEARRLLIGQRIKQLVAELRP